MLLLHLLTKRLTSQLPVVLCAILLVAMFLLQLTTAMQESQTIDEGVHLSAGLSYWKTHDFRMNPEHPPLIKYLAALPLLFTKVQLPLDSAAWANWDQWTFGDLFVYNNTLPPETILLLGRIPVMVVSVFLGILIFIASRRLFGPWPAVLSVALYAFDPGFIAHGHYVTTDLGFAAFGLWAVMRLNSFLATPTNKNLLWLGTAMWITGLAKFSVIPLMACIIAVLIILKIIYPPHPALDLKRWWKKILLALPIVWLITWAVYGFDVRRPNEDPRIEQLYQQRDEFLEHGDISGVPEIEKYVINDLGDKNSVIGSWFVRASEMSIPNYAWLRGWITVIGHSIGGQEAYLLGRFENFGWWYYFPIAVLIKTPLPTLAVMLGIALIIAVAAIRARRSPGGLRELIIRHQPWFLYVTVPTLFFGLSLTSHLNLGWRYVMFIYPFIFIMAGALASPMIIKNRLFRLVIPLTLGMGMIIVQIKTYPNELGYFNALIGGSVNGPKYLIDSNIDWGQDLPKLEKFMKENNVNVMPFAYFGRPPAAERLSLTNLPTVNDPAGIANLHGYAAISVHQLYRRDGLFDWLKKYQPVEILGSSIYIYNLP